MEDEKQLILAKDTLNDIDPIMGSYIDISIGKENTFLVKVARQKWRPEMTFGNVVYIKNTEYGGIIGEVDSDTSADEISLQGYTWRGLLDKKIIQPPAGQDYKKVSGELNQVIGTLISGQFGEYFSVSQENTGVTVSNYQFDRYCTLLAGIVKMLKSVGYRLRIKYIQQEEGQPAYIELAAVPIVDLSQQIELSQDSRLNFTFKNVKNGVNHLVCLGKGELKDRQVINLYVQENGSIGTTQYYTGLQEIAATYEDTSSDSAALQEKGTEKLQDLMNHTEFSMDVASLDIDVEIGDIVGGRDYITGMYAAKPVAQKIYHVENGAESIEYELEGEDE